MKILCSLLTLLMTLAMLPAQEPSPSSVEQLLALPNLHAWCVVPFDAKQRGPEERAQMLQRLGFTRFVYDWRAKDIPTLTLRSRR